MVSNILRNTLVLVATSSKPQPDVLVQVDVISAISEDHFDQVSQYEVKVDQDYSHQIASDPPVFCLI